MIICYVTRKHKVGWTNHYEDMEGFYKDNPSKVIEWAFDEKDDLLNGDLIINGKPVLGKANLKTKLKDTQQ